jgi:hypothetical protein
VLGGFFNVLLNLNILLKNESMIGTLDDLEEMIFTNSRILFKKNDNFILISILEKNVSELDREIINSIHKKFEEEFSEILQNWDKNLAIFQSFDSICNNILEKYVKKY